MAHVVYKDVSEEKTTVEDNFVNIEELVIQLPAGNGHALMMLNLSDPYALGDVAAGIACGIEVDGVIVVSGATHSRVSQKERRPVTLTTEIPLKAKQQNVKALWCAPRGGIAHLGSHASLSAILDV